VSAMLSLLAGEDDPADLAARGGGADLAARGGGADLAARGGGADLAARGGGADLAARGGGAWLAEGALVIVERATRSGPVRWPEGLVPDRARRYGEATFWYGRAQARG
jgi:hypothetical protein